MCTPFIEATSSIARMLAIKFGLRGTSIGKNLKGEICVKVFDLPFVSTVKVLDEVQSQIVPIVSLLMHTLEVKQVYRSIHELVIIPSVL